MSHLTRLRDNLCWRVFWNNLCIPAADLTRNFYSHIKKWKVKVLVAQSCPTLCDHMDCSLPGSSVHGILQTRILELPFPSPGDTPASGIKPGSPALQADSLPSELPEKPTYMGMYTYKHKYMYIYKYIVSIHTGPSDDCNLTFSKIHQFINFSKLVIPLGN